MRLASIITFILASGLGWQSTVAAGIAGSCDRVYADGAKNNDKRDEKDKKQGSSNDEPECE